MASKATCPGSPPRGCGADGPGNLSMALAQPGVIRAAGPVVDLLAGGILGDAVTLLHLARELVAAPGGGREIIIGELAPLLLGTALELLPVTFDAIPVHLLPPCRLEHSLDALTITAQVAVFKDPRHSLSGRKMPTPGRREAS